MSDGPNPVEEFKRVTAATMRAMAHRRELTVSFTGEPPGIEGEAAHLPLPSRELSYDEVSNLRGEADSMALRLRHHNPKAHSRHMPRGQIARTVYEAVEQARVEAIGTRRMAGVAANLNAALEERSRSRGYNRITERDDER